VVFSPDDFVRLRPAEEKELQARIDLLHSRNSKDKDFHLFAVRSGVPALVVSSSGATNFDMETSGASEAVKITVDALGKCISLRGTVTTPLYTDEQGLWVTSFAAVTDSTRRVVGVLAADRRATEYSQLRDATISRMLYYSALAVLASTVVGFFVTVRITRPLKLLYDAALAAREGRFKPVPVSGNDEVATLARSFNETNVALDRKIAELAQLNSELEDRVASRTRELSASYDELRKRSDVLQREMNTARKVQETIIPKSLHRERIDIDVAYVPILEIGGDLGLVVERGDNRYDVAVGDVTGHGIGAALVGNRVHTLLSGLYSSDAPLDSLFHRLDFFLSQEISEIGMFLTLLACRFDLERMVMECGGGGHVGALHYRPSTGALSEVEGRCGIIGAGELFCDAQPVSTTPIERGDSFLLYTDGLVDATNPEGAAFGKERLSTTFVSASGERDDGRITATIVAAAKDFTGGRFQDDVLVLAVQIK
jgi:serine phosphatase RsbU (regulator of sigma subunit)